MRENSLEIYLKAEIEKLQKEVENKKNRHYVNQKLIEESREKIRCYRDKEDSVFGLLSPITTESPYKDQVAEENRIINECNEENMCLIAEMDKINEKIEEISDKLNENLYCQTKNVSEEGNKSAEDYSSTHSISKKQAEVIIAEIYESINDGLELIKKDPNLCRDRLRTAIDKLNQLFY